MNPFVIHLIPGKGSIQSIKWPGKSATFFMIIDLISLFDWFFFFTRTLLKKLQRFSYHFGNFISIILRSTFGRKCRLRARESNQAIKPDNIDMNKTEIFLYNRQYIT